MARTYLLKWYVYSFRKMYMHFRNTYKNYVNAFFGIVMHFEKSFRKKVI
jgi:hypothetical protein